MLPAATHQEPENPGTSSEAAQARRRSRRCALDVSSAQRPAPGWDAASAPPQTPGRLHARSGIAFPDMQEGEE